MQLGGRLNAGMVRGLPPAVPLAPHVGRFGRRRHVGNFGKSTCRGEPPVRAVASNHYEHWMTGMEQGPVMSHQVLPTWLPDALAGSEGRPLFLVVIDNLRWDQWRVIAPVLSDDWNIAEEDVFQHLAHGHAIRAQRLVRAGMTPPTSPGQSPSVGSTNPPKAPRTPTRPSCRKRCLSAWA